VQFALFAQSKSLEVNCFDYRISVIKHYLDIGYMSSN